MPTKIRPLQVPASSKGGVLIEVAVLSVELEGVFLARSLLTEHPTLPTRDAIHAAVAIRKQLSHIVSYDKDFDDLTELSRIEP